MNVIQKLLLPLFRRAGQRHLVYGNRSKALAIFAMLCRWSDTPDNQFNLALARMNLRQYTEAIALLEKIHKILPNQLFAGVTYAQCLMLARRFEEAEALYSELLEANPGNNLLSMLVSLSQNPVGRDKFATSLDLQYRASLLAEEKKTAEALSLLKQAVELTPDDAALHNNLGALKLKLKYPLKEVMADFSRAMQLSPDNDRYKRNYRKVWLKSQKPKS